MEFLALLRWSLMLAVLWAAALPLTKRLFPRFPTAGAAFGLPVALFVVSLPAYWVGKLDATAGFVVGGLTLLTLSLLTLRTGTWPDPKTLRIPLAVFAVAFGALLVVRLGYPWIVPAGGEKFLDFSLLKAVLRAETFPPEDPWFAGRTVRYYYGGYLISGFLTTLSGLEARYAYNLLVPTFYAALATGAYGLAAAIADRSGSPPVVAGLAAAFLSTASGTLATPARLLLGLFPEQLAREYGRAIVSGIRAPYGEAFAQATTPGEWSYWLGRYVIPRTVDVFPSWTFVNGDLRPHMTSAPFLVLAAALVFAYYRTPEEDVWRRRALLLFVLPALGGLLGVVNTWELPVVVGLTFLAVTFADADPRSLLGPAGSRFPRFEGLHSIIRRDVGRLLGGGVAALVVGAIAVAWVAPYFLYHTATSDGVGFLPPGSPLVPFLLVHGGFLVLFALLLWTPTRHTLRNVGGTRALLLGLAIGVAALAVAGFAPVALLAVFGLAAWVVVRRQRAEHDGDVSQRSGGFTVLLVLAGVGLLIFAELAYAKVWPYNPNALRWNTVYKIYHSVWILWGIGGGVAVAAILSKALRGLSARSSGERVRPVAAVLLVVAVVSAMAVFPAFAGGERANAAIEGEATLDGLGYVNDSHPDAGAAIAWLDSREGTPTITSAPGIAIYQWMNAPSSLTGIPTVLGWVHEKGYRGSKAYEDRREDVERLYESNANTTLAIAEKYDVEYIYVGPNERERYDLREFGSHERITPVFEKGTVTIYSVRADNASS
ncbi:DUF2298 domain-containing protein [Halarchaeum salinum]